jgi:methionyl-tRNA synthetase
VFSPRIAGGWGRAKKAGSIEQNCRLETQKFCNIMILVMRDKIKAVVQTKKDSDYVWICDFCGEEFKTKKESDKHELTCEKNPVVSKNHKKFIKLSKILE